MVLAGHMALSSSDDETLKDGGKYLAARFAGFQDRFHRLQERSRTIFLRRQRLNAERERREKQDALEKEEQEEQAVWNTSLHVLQSKDQNDSCCMSVLLKKRQIDTYLILPTRWSVVVLKGL